MNAKKKLENVADSVLSAMTKKQNDVAATYREHVRSLVEADFVNLGFTVGNVTLTWIAKASTTKDFHAIVIRILEIVGGSIEPEGPYEGQDGKQTPGYA